MNKWDLKNWKRDVRHKSRCQLQLHQALCRRHRSLGCCMIVRRTAAFTSQVGYRMRNKLSTPRRRYPQQSLPEASRANNHASQHRKRARTTRRRRRLAAPRRQLVTPQGTLQHKASRRRRRYCRGMEKLQKFGVGTSLPCHPFFGGRRLRSCCFSGASSL